PPHSIQYNIAFAWTAFNNLSQSRQNIRKRLSKRKQSSPIQTFFRNLLTYSRIQPYTSADQEAPMLHLLFSIRDNAVIQQPLASGRHNPFQSLYRIGGQPQPSPKVVGRTGRNVSQGQMG